MDIETTELGPCKKRLSVTISAERIDQGLEKSYGTLRSNVSIPGFRPGKIPRRLLERRYGDHVRREVTEDLVEETIREAIQELGIELVSQAELVRPGADGETEEADTEESPLLVTPGEDLELSFDVEVKPDFELPEYKGIEVTRRVKEISEEDLQKGLEARAEQLASVQPFESFEPGDAIVADVQILDGDEVVEEIEEAEFEPGIFTVHNHRLEGVDELLVGKKAEDDISVPVAAEEEGAPKLTAKLHLLEFKRRVVPPIDDDLAAELGMENLAALKEDTRKSLEAHAEALGDRDVVQQVVDDILDRAEIPIAEGPIERMLERRVRQKYIEFVIDGMNQEEAEAKVEDLRQEIREEIEKDSRSWFLFEKIAKKEKIFCMEDDVDQRIQDIAVDSGSTPTKVREYYESKDMMPDLRTGILEEKVCNFLRDKAKIIEAAGAAESESEEEAK